jgi:hypothetical protein
VLADHGLVFREVDAKRLVVGDIAFDPLNIGRQLVEDLVRFGCGASQLLALEAADLGDVALDYEFTQGHICLPSFCDVAI